MDNKLVTSLYSNELLKLMNEMLDDFILSDYNEEEIYEEFKFMNESVRMGMYLISINKDFIYLSKRIDKVNRKINKERKEKFIEAYENGSVEKFLATLGKGDKISLLNDLGIDTNINNRKKCSKVELDYYKVITDSIKSGQKDDIRNGIDSFLKYKKEKLSE